MVSKWQRVKNFLNDESGQSTTEYILILAVVVMVAMKFKSTFGNTLSTLLTGLNTQISGFNDSTGQ